MSCSVFCFSLLASPCATLFKTTHRQAGETYLKQKKKELSTKGHEERRRATKALRLAATGCQGHDRIVDFRLFHSRLIRTARRGQGSRTNGSFPKGAGRFSEKSPAGYPPAHHRDSTPRERGRLARMLSLGLPLSFPALPQPAPPAGGNRLGPAEAEPWRRCRSIRVEEMGEAIPRFVRAGRPRSRGAFSHDVVTPPSQ